MCGDSARVLALLMLLFVALPRTTGLPTACGVHWYLSPACCVTVRLQLSGSVVGQSCCLLSVDRQALQAKTLGSESAGPTSDEYLTPLTVSPQVHKGVQRQRLLR